MSRHPRVGAAVGVILVLTALPLGVPDRSAMATSGPCVSISEFQRVTKGMRMKRVHNIFDTHGSRDWPGSFGKKLQIRRYPQCGEPAHRVYVKFHYRRVTKKNIYIPPRIKDIRVSCNRKGPHRYDHNLTATLVGGRFWWVPYGGAPRAKVDVLTRTRRSSYTWDAISVFTGNQKGFWPYQRALVRVRPTKTSTC